MKIKQIFDYLCDLAPLEKQLSFDNAGFLVGREDREVKKVLLSLDVTADVINEAAEGKYELIISHHPLIFNAIKSVTDEKLLRLVENGIAVISMHTNLDITEGGVNDVLLGLLGAEKDGYLDVEFCGRTGHFNSPLSMPAFLELCREKLHANGLRYYDAKRPVENIAVLGGAGSDELEDAIKKGCDTYLTSEIKYHHFLMAQEYGINLIDGDHFGTEDPVIDMLCQKLSAQFPDVVFDKSIRHGAVIKFCC